MSGKSERGPTANWPWMLHLLQATLAFIACLAIGAYLVFFTLGVVLMLPQAPAAAVLLTGVVCVLTGIVIMACLVRTFERHFPMGARVLAGVLLFWMASSLLIEAAQPGHGYALEILIFMLAGGADFFGPVEPGYLTVLPLLATLGVVVLLRKEIRRTRSDSGDLAADNGKH